MSRNGRIVTFYSYRGGVGRTTALANVAWILASNGHRVLAVDWDLESPSLHRSFHPFLDDKALRSTRGVLEVLRDHVTLTNQPGPAALDPNEKPIVERYTVDLQYTFPGDGCLHFIPAGQQTSGYSEMVSTFDWDAFYDRMDGGRFVEALALDMRDNYDFTLIDSRTGLSDTAGICTVAIPDTVVNCLPPARRASRQRWRCRGRSSSRRPTR